MAMINHIIGIIAMLLGLVAMALQNYESATGLFLFAFVLCSVLSIEELCIPNKAERDIKAKAVTEFAEKLKEYYPSIANGIDYTAEEVLKGVIK